MKLRLALCAAIAAAVVLPAGPALAKLAIHVSTTSGRPGEKISVDGSSPVPITLFLMGDEESLGDRGGSSTRLPYLQQLFLARVRSTRAGELRGSFTVPDVPAGTYTVDACSSDGRHDPFCFPIGDEDGFTVTARPARAEPSDSDAGAGIPWPAVAGAAPAVALGAWALRRRRPEVLTAFSRVYGESRSKPADRRGEL